MLEFLNEVLLISDDEPDFAQMGISGKSPAKMGGAMKGNKRYDATLHPRYPKGHPKGGKFMTKGSPEQIATVARAKGISPEQAASLIKGEAKPNKGKLKKFEGSAGAVGKAQKVLRDKESTPEQRAKAKAQINKAAMKMRGEAPASTEKPKRGKISNKEIMARNMGESSAPASTDKPKSASKKAGKPTGSMTQDRKARRKELVIQTAKRLS